MYAPLIFGTQSGEKFITVESVYAVFDSKPKITKQTLEYTNDKVKSVATMFRTTRDVTVAGKKTEKRNLTHIFGGILAGDSLQPPRVEEYCKQYSFIDFGCAPKAFSFLIKRQQASNELVRFVHSNKEEAILAFFYILLNELYEQGTVAGMDIREYADHSMCSMKLERVEE